MILYLFIIIYFFIFWLACVSSQPQSIFAAPHRHLSHVLSSGLFSLLSLPHSVPVAWLEDLKTPSNKKKIACKAKIKKESVHNFKGFVDKLNLYIQIVMINARHALKINNSLTTLKRIPYGSLTTVSNFVTTFLLRWSKERLSFQNVTPNF